MTRTKIVFLYSELAGYFLACLETLAKDADVLVIHWPINPEAPFKFYPSDSIQLVNKNEFSLGELIDKIEKFKPDTVVCSGWMDKEYLKIMRTIPKKIPRVMTLDNHWEGSWRQQIGALISPFYLKRIFSHSWVPGFKQEKFALKLGFKNKIIKGFYCADTDLFDKKYKESFDKKKEVFPKRFLYVARYVRHKGIFEMWQAFAELQAENPNEWELWCLGTGDEWEQRLIHHKIKHVGFVQPSEMDGFIEKTGVYILPSKFEPWGVSVQEFAIAGFPLILSDAIGSAEQFLTDNGFSVKAGDVASLKTAMKKIMERDMNELIEMGETSHVLGMKYTTQDWAKKILELNG